MKLRDLLIALITSLLLGFHAPVSAGTSEEEAEQAARAELQAQLESDYREALTQVEKQRREAEATMEKAREQLEQASEQQKRSEEEKTRVRAAESAEMARMHEELSHARRELQQTSREIARVNREVARARASSDSSSYGYSTQERPVLGVILGEANEVGVKILGVSPDGPAERAGIEQGDFIIALGGRVLAATDESGNALSGLNIALEDIKAGEPVIVSVERDDKTIDLSVVPEVREPLGWHTITRFPSAPESPGSPGRMVTVERIVVPEIDTEALAEQIEQIRVEVDERRRMMKIREPAHGEYEIELHDMSELGDLALHEANIWFGLPMTQGLKLAEIDADLGSYFKTDRGVLVLKAKTDNELQLKSGDVILKVGDTDVNSPSDFMRTLREFEEGQELHIDVKRDGKDKTLKTIMPEDRLSFIAPLINQTHSFKFTHHND
jgi:C-terminal processing protease CtpA/Prc